MVNSLFPSFFRQYDLENHNTVSETFSKKREKSEQDQLAALQVTLKWILYKFMFCKTYLTVVASEIC